MRSFEIEALDETFGKEVFERIENLAKPRRALGRLEDIALQISKIQGTLYPTLERPHHILFSADHGIEEEGVSKSPRAVTWQQTINFKRQGTAIDYLTRQHDIELIVVDSGVDYIFPKELGIIDSKVRRGTSNFRYGPAMSREEANLCIEMGAKQSEIAFGKGCNIISFGEMGIGNTSPSSIWMHLLTQIPLSDCIGSGSGLVDKELVHKEEVLTDAIHNYHEELDAEGIMSYFGGFEMVMTVGAMLRAAELKMTIVVDGFIMTACMLMASQLQPNVLQYAIFGHCGDEKGHRLLLQHLGANPLLNLQMKLGEGTGAICAYPIIKSAVLMMTEMSLFGNDNPIDKYF